jgi:thymidylate kinase
MTTARAAGPAVHPRVRAAFAALDAAGLRWALLRGLEELGAPEGDVDILVEPAAGDLNGVLAGAGFVRLPARGHGSHGFYAAYEASNDAWVLVDVVTDVAFGRFAELRTALAPALLARRQRIGSVAVLNRADAFWHLLLHDLLGRGEIDPRRRSALSALLGDAAAGSPVATLVARLAPGIDAALHAAVADGDWAAVGTLGRALRRAWLVRRPRARIEPALRALERRLPPPDGRGLSIGIIGPDGAGKTTLADALRASMPVPTRYVYLGIWRHSRIEARLRRVVGARLALRLVKLVAKSALIRLERARGLVVLLDRYTCDADLPSDELDWKGRVSAWLVRRTCAEPDLLILLDAPAEVMYARKGEHGIGELQLRRDAYLAMGDRYPQLVVVDATRPAADVRSRATALVLDALSRRRSRNEPPV